MSEPDPPWLDEAERMVKSGLALDATPRQIARVVGKFADRQRRAITEAMVEAGERDLRMAREHWDGWFCDLPDNPTLVEALANLIAVARDEGRQEIRQITDAIVEAAAAAFWNTRNDGQSNSAAARAALEAAEKARRDANAG